MIKTKLTDNVRNRANEIRLRALVFQMLKATNNNFELLSEYIKCLSNLFDFNDAIIIEIMREILDNRYAPTTDEVIKINLLLGLTIREIADKLDMKESTVKMHIYRNKDNINTILIYPRLKQEQLEELRKFLKQYYSLYVPANKVFKI